MSYPEGCLGEAEVCKARPATAISVYEDILLGDTIWGLVQRVISGPSFSTAIGVVICRPPSASVTGKKSSSQVRRIRGVEVREWKARRIRGKGSPSRLEVKRSRPVRLEV